MFIVIPFLFGVAVTAACYRVYLSRKKKFIPLTSSKINELSEISKSLTHHLKEHNGDLYLSVGEDEERVVIHFHQHPGVVFYFDKKILPQLICALCEVSKKTENDGIADLVTQLSVLVRLSY